MPLDQRNLTMAKDIGLIFSLFDITSAREVPFGILQYTQCIQPMFSFVYHSSLLTAKSIDLVVAHDGFLSQQKSSVFFAVFTLITKELFQQLLIRTAV